ncbi:MAG: transposase [Chlorobi bacterium]|nr:transposase [Chlorobiota bacterium]
MPRKNPKGPLATLQDLAKDFANPETCIMLVAAARWPDGVQCPRCGSKESHIYIQTRRMWECKGCRKQFGVKFGTIFESSRLSLDKWLMAFWLLVNAKNGISSCELSRALGVTQKTAWFLLQRIRYSLHIESHDEKLSGIVEVDETYIGGKARNMHKGKKDVKIKGRGATGKAIVMGLLERHGEIRTKVVGDIKRKTLQDEIIANVELGSEVHTDQLASYRGIDPEYVHNVVNHAETYVNGHVYTNGLENFWSLLKRTIGGTYTSCEPFHLFRYLDEQMYRFNTRKGDDRDRFVKSIGTVVGKRLSYRRLIGEEENVKPRRAVVRRLSMVCYVNPKAPKKYRNLIVNSARSSSGNTAIILKDSKDPKLIWYRYKGIEAWTSPAYKRRYGSL